MVSGEVEADEAGCACDQDFHNFLSAKSRGATAVVPPSLTPAPNNVRITNVLFSNCC